MKRFLLLFFWSLLCNSQQYEVRTVAFYNVENLFDTENDTLILDDDRTPQGVYGWTTKRYQNKIANISKVLSQIGFEVTDSAPDIIGVCEVENFKVLQDLANHPNLKKYNYKIIHEDSPDERGIDVALLYKEGVFIPTSFDFRRLLLFNNDGFRNYTRDQLVVSGYMLGEALHFIVNHWPSRSGGTSRSQPDRIKAAQLTHQILDSLRQKNPGAKVLITGDFNDNPVDDSICKTLKGVSNSKKMEGYQLFNPMQEMFKKGQGTLAYRDQWNLFDQMLVTKELATAKEGYKFWKAGIYAPDYLKVRSGQYKGYPIRTYVGTSYQGGYADHFPIYCFLIRLAP